MGEVAEDGGEADGGGVFGFHGVGDPGFVVVVLFLEVALGGFLFGLSELLIGAEVFGEVEVELILA
jgi:hypothetical protein